MLIIGRMGCLENVLSNSVFDIFFVKWTKTVFIVINYLLIKSSRWNVPLNEIGSQSGVFMRQLKELEKWRNQSKSKTGASPELSDTIWHVQSVQNVKTQDNDDLATTQCSIWVKNVFCIKVWQVGSHRQNLKTQNTGFGYRKGSKFNPTRFSEPRPYSMCVVSFVIWPIPISSRRQLWNAKLNTVFWLQKEFKNLIR